MATKSSREPLTVEELTDLAQKLKALGKDLTPKERWFLTESLRSGIVGRQAEEIEGYTLSSAVQGGTVYYPAGAQTEFGRGTPPPAGPAIFVFELEA